MDSVTQIVLGAAVGEAVLGRKLGRKAIAWGAIAGTIPDLDVFISFGDAVKDFTYHRAASHSLFVLAALTPLMVWLINRIHPQSRNYKNHWALMIYLVFATHVLLDSFTAYGTQIFWPFVTTPVAWSTIFIIDPLYTIPMTIGVLAALVMTRATNRGHLFNRFGLIISAVYLSWTLIAKISVEENFRHALQEQNIPYQKIFTTPTPFNSLLWRAVVVDDHGYYEAFFSVLDHSKEIRFDHYQDRKELLENIRDHWPVRRLQWFSKGFYTVKKQQDDIVISDLRMGLEPDYVFQFKVGKIGNPHARPSVPERLEPNRNWGLLKHVWHRIWNKEVRLKKAGIEDYIA